MRFSLKETALALAAGAVTALLATVPAAAQQAADSPWVKICNTDPSSQQKVCLITQELRTDTGQFLASLAIREVDGEARRRLLASVPVGMLLQPGLQLQIDDKEAVRAQYSICFPNACYAELPLDNDAMIKQMKAGGKLRLTVLNQQAKPVPFEMSLVGFTATYDGAGMAPEELQARNEELQQELNRRAEEARQRLIEEQRKATEGNAN
jgi:invasion protein IalB